MWVGLPTRLLCQVKSGVTLDINSRKREVTRLTTTKECLRRRVPVTNEWVITTYLRRGQASKKPSSLSWRVESGFVDDSIYLGILTEYSKCEKGGTVSLYKQVKRKVKCESTRQTLLNRDNTNDVTPVSYALTSGLRDEKTSVET